MLSLAPQIIWFQPYNRVLSDFGRGTRNVTRAGAISPAKTMRVNCLMSPLSWPTQYLQAFDEPK